MAIFNSYASLPEGKTQIRTTFCGWVEPALRCAAHSEKHGMDMSSLSVCQCNSSSFGQHFKAKTPNLGMIRVTSNHERDGRTSVNLCHFMKPTALETASSFRWNQHMQLTKKFIPRCLKATINKVSHSPLPTETPGIPYWDVCDKPFWLCLTRSICLADGSSNLCIPAQVSMTKL